MNREETRVSVTFPKNHSLGTGFVTHFVSIHKATYNSMPGESSTADKTSHILIYHYFKTVEELIDLVIELGGDGYHMEYLEVGKWTIRTSWRRRHSQKDSASFRTIFVKGKNVHNINMITINAESKAQLERGYQKPKLLITAKMQLVTFEIPKWIYKKSTNRKRYIKVPDVLMPAITAALRDKQCTIIEDQWDSLILFLIETQQKPEELRVFTTSKLYFSINLENLPALNIFLLLI